MAQNKIDYQENYPNCLKCGKIIKESSFKIVLTPKAVFMNDDKNTLIKSTTGEIVSVETYERINGICNTCLYDLEGVDLK